MSLPRLTPHPPTHVAWLTATFPCSRPCPGAIGRRDRPSVGPRAGAGPSSTPFPSPCGVRLTGPRAWPGGCTWKGHATQRTAGQGRGRDLLQPIQGAAGPALYWACSPRPPPPRPPAPPPPWLLSPPHCPADRLWPPSAVWLIPTGWRPCAGVAAYSCLTPAGRPGGVGSGGKAPAIFSSFSSKASGTQRPRPPGASGPVSLRGLEETFPAGSPAAEPALLPRPCSPGPTSADSPRAGVPAQPVCVRPHLGCPGDSPNPRTSATKRGHVCPLSATTGHSTRAQLSAGRRSHSLSFY